MKTKRKTRVAIYWKVDGSSGTTVLDNATKADALAYFKATFAPYGYNLISIEILP